MKTSAFVACPAIHRVWIDNGQAPVLAVVPDQLPVPLPLSPVPSFRKRHWAPEVPPEVPSGSTAGSAGTSGKAGSSGPTSGATSD